MTGGVEFDEEQTYSSSVVRQEEIPEKGIEGWVYNKIPGKYSYKKNIMIFVIIFIFALAFIFFVLGFQNLDSGGDKGFTDRVNNTSAK